jgi:glycosyltransferase involved in cell wall biosynthesis
VVGDAGILLDQDVHAWTQALIDLANDPEKRTNLSKGGLARSATFTWRRAAEQTVAAYREAIELNRRG